MKQTALEWLVQEMDYLIPSDKELLILQIVNKAKEMEKKQQGYSEEEVKDILLKFNNFKEVHHAKGNLILDYNTRMEWFEQFKKK